jgi:DNA-binding transcriptional LysR family regulator
MLDIRKLVILRAVAAEGSIAAAARALRFSRSAVSQQLSALERETGLPGGTRWKSNPRGNAGGRSNAGQNTDDVAGLLRVGIPFREGPRIMSRALSRLRDRYPELVVRR